MFHIHGWDRQVFLIVFFLFQNDLNMSSSKHTAKVTDITDIITEEQTDRQLDVDDYWMYSDEDL
jgi:hypothetical protein